MKTRCKSAAVYRHGDYYFVHANSMTDAGFWVASMPATRLPDGSTIDALGAAVAEALAASASGAPTLAGDEHRAADKPLLKVAGVRSWSALQRSAALCNVWQTADAVTVEPTRNGGTGGDDRGYHPLVDQRIVIPAEIAPRELGRAVLDAFDKCA